MQPLQCVLQHHLHIHAAITMRFASTRCRTPTPAAHRRYLSSPAAFTLHDLHIHAAITMWFASTRCRTQSETQPRPPHTRHITRKHTRFGAPASSPKQSPCNNHAAITMRFAASRGKPACIYAHGNRTWPESDSHYSAICSQRLKKRIKVRTHEQPHVAEHQGRTDSTMKRSQPQPPHTHKVPFIASSSHITRKHRVWCSGFLSNTTPTQVHATFMPPLQCVLQHHVAKPACIYAHDNCLTTRNSNHAVIALRSATTDATNTEKQKVWCSGFLPKTNPM